MLQRSCVRHFYNNSDGINWACDIHWKTVAVIKILTYDFTTTCLEMWAYSRKSATLMKLPKGLYRVLECWVMWSPRHVVYVSHNASRQGVAQSQCYILVRRVVVIAKYTTVRVEVETFQKILWKQPIYSQLAFTIASRNNTLLSVWDNQQIIRPE